MLTFKAFEEVTKDEFYFIIVIFLIGFISSFISGMVGISVVEIFFATIAVVWAYRNSGLLNKTIIVYMGGAILMFIPNKGLDNVSLNQVQFNKWLAAGLALIAGLAAEVRRR